MLNRILTIAALAASTFISVNAEPTDYRLRVENFSELTVVDGIGVDCYCCPDSAGWAVFTCEPKFASEITFTNNAEHLSIQTTADETPIVGMPRVRVYTAGLRKVENSGDSLVRVYDTKIPAVTFKAIQIGNGRLEIYDIAAENLEAGVATGKGTLQINGTADKSKIRNVGTGFIDASGLTTPDMKCFIFGTGDIVCSATEKLKIYGAGSGKVVYSGQPSKITNRSIGVKYENRNSTGEAPSRVKTEILSANN